MRVKHSIPARASPHHTCPFDLAALGCSAGGYHALLAVLGPLPENFPASIVVVQHLSREYKSVLPELLRRDLHLVVKHAEHGEPMRTGIVYIAPPDDHLLVGPGILQLVHTELVHFSRPSIDLLFESVAGVYGARAIGMLLTGGGSDGVEGLRTIKQKGGTTIAQDPAGAEFRTLPAAAVASHSVDYILPLEEIGPTLMKLCPHRNKRQ